MKLSQQMPAIALDVLHQVNDTETPVKARNSTLYLAMGAGTLV